MSRADNLIKRKAEIIEAALSVLYRQGFCDLRISDVAKQAGVSAGLICHHFDTKQGLLRAVMTHAVDAFEEQSKAALSTAQGTKTKILALVRLALGPEQMAPEYSAAWLALYYLASADPDYREILRRYQEINFTNIQSALRETLPPGEVESKASLIVALVDGVWLQNAAQSQPVDIDKVQRLAVELATVVLRTPPD